MPDLLSHLFIAYSISLLLSWRYRWIDNKYIVICLVGSIIPDLSKIYLVIPSNIIENILGIQFSWLSLTTTGGVFISVLIGGLSVDPKKRKPVFILLMLGSITHLVSDYLLKTPTGHSYPIFWPLTQWHPPTPGLYLSTQPQPTIITAIIAISIYTTTKYRE